MDVKRTLALFICVCFILTPFLGLFSSSPIASAQAKEGTVTKTTEGWSLLNFKWDTNNIGNPYLINLSLNRGWAIEDASIGVSGSPVVTDQGTQWETWEYPERPRLDVGRNGDDWEFPGLLGYQNLFANESDMEEPAFSSNDEQYLYIPLPVGADLKNIEFEVNNTQSGQFEYMMYIGSSTKRVWYKSSIGFSEGPLVPTGTYGVNAVCVNHLDFLFDSYNDLVGVGEGGSLFIAKHDETATETEGYRLETIPIGMGDPLPGLLSCAVGDYDQDISNDIAVSATDGKMYVIKNEGFGTFGIPQTLSSDIATSRMESVAFGDVNNDAWQDVIGGYLRGQFFVATYDSSKNAFNTPYEVKAGTGAMNDVAAGDMDLDAINDLIGANNDRNWWYVKNEAGKTWKDPVPVRSGGSDLTSLVVVDVNWDNSPDLISGSQDGAFYVSYNLGGSFDEGVSLVGGLESMKDVIAGDLDLDGDMDILGLNSDGWVYLVKNEFGFLKDGVKLIEVGKSVNSIALGDLDNDNDLDMICGNNKGFQIYWNNLGPFAMMIGQDDGGLLKKEVQNYLDKYRPYDEDYDAYGNLIVDVPFRIKSTYPGTILFENVNVTYAYEASVDIKTPLNLYIKSHKENADAAGFINVPIQILTDSPGILHIANISVSYKEEFMAIIKAPVDGAEFNTSQAITFQGYSNEDLTGTSGEIEYSWMVDGRVFGTGSTLKVPAADVEVWGVGSHSIRFTAKKPSRETAHSTIIINLVPPKAPYLTLKISLPKDKSYVEDKRILVPVEVVNSGAVNASNIGVVLNDGSRKVGSKTVPLVAVGNNQGESVEIAWTPAEGDHKICTAVVPDDTPHKDHCVQVYVTKKETDYTIFLIILVMIVMGGIVGYFAIRYKQKADERRIEKEKKEMQEKLKAEMQSDFADLYGAEGPPITDEYAAAGYGQEAYGYDAYDPYAADASVGAYGGYGAVSPDYVVHKCPRCGAPTTEHGVQCFACDAKDSVKYAEEAIKEVKELGIDVDEAEDLLRTAKSSLRSGDYEIALEEAEEAEDIANEVKDRYEKAFAMISDEAAESAAERRRKRLERRKAAREKKEKMHEMQAREAAEGGGETGGE